MAIHRLGRLAVPGAQEHRGGRRRGSRIIWDIKISSTEYTGEGTDARVRGETSRNRSSAAAVNNATLSSPSSSTSAVFTSAASCPGVDAGIVLLVYKSSTTAGVNVLVRRTHEDVATVRLVIVRRESLRVSTEE